MTTPTPEQIEAAARALYEIEPWQIASYSNDTYAWKALTPGDRYNYYRTATAALSAAAPFIAAQAKAEVFPLIRDLADPDECWFDHNGACQAHGYYSIKPGETCPQHDAKVWLSMYAEETKGKDS